jgi:hypothetical protein
VSETAEAARPPSNRELAACLSEVADLLERQGDNPFKVRAYREGADVLLGLARPACDLVREGGPEALRRLPGIGKGLARAVADLCATGRLALLDRLRAEVAPEQLLGDVPGIGPALDPRGAGARRARRAARPGSGHGAAARPRRARVAGRAPPPPAPPGGAPRRRRRAAC